MSDAPDWQRIVATVLSAGAMSDAPDWTRVVVGPGGAPVGGKTAVARSGTNDTLLTYNQSYLGPVLLVPSTGAWVIVSVAGFATNGAFTGFSMYHNINITEGSYDNRYTVGVSPEAPISGTGSVSYTLGNVIVYFVDITAAPLGVQNFISNSMPSQASVYLYSDIIFAIPVQYFQ